MSALGGIFVDLEALSPGVATSYLVELRDRFDPTIPFDVRGRSDSLNNIAGVVRWLNPDARALAIASAHAVERGHLLVVFAPVLPEAAVVQGLLEGLEEDELVGFTQPRFSDAASDGIWFLPGDGKASEGLLPRQALPLLPEHYLVTEQLAGCVAVRREVAAGFAVDPENRNDVRVMLLHEMRNARRCGYRTLVMNRLIVASRAPQALLYSLKQPANRNTTRVIARMPQARSADDWFNGAIHRRREFLAAKARRAHPTEHLPVLLDCRGVVAHHNGTSEAVCGLLEGLEVASSPLGRRFDIRS